MKSVKQFPPRIHCLIAPGERKAVVIRRGPSDTVCIIGWDMKADTFVTGQWMRGRIYERRSDLSPDGRHLIYFAMNGKMDSETRGSWTAISQAPHLKALVLLAKGDCWHGGGLFTGKKTYWLNDGYGHELLRDNSCLMRDQKHKPPHYFGGECLTVYYNRLMRDGWRMVEGTEKTEAHVVFEKTISSEIILRKYCHAGCGNPPGKGVYYDTHALVYATGGIVAKHPTWEWADFDGKRLLYADTGKLYRASPNETESDTPTLLHDFNDMKFEALAAPY